MLTPMKDAYVRDFFSVPLDDSHYHIVSDHETSEKVNLSLLRHDLCDRYISKRSFFQKFLDLTLFKGWFDFYHFTSKDFGQNALFLGHDMLFFGARFCTVTSKTYTMEEDIACIYIDYSKKLSRRQKLIISCLNELIHENFGTDVEL